ncbi:hypothetical protein C1H76_7453 [Elsinoe australis]|uniref:F-box domain-containing protein n=1 Tax=Elsinoe australis TaxID=40998 RepID=A0A4U7AQW6_9PEZI|nr:hypothetical protein C1H76_7453 [Elsinoe australis]
MESISAVRRLFAIPELLSLILSYLPPSSELYSLDGPTVDDHRSQAVIDRAQCLAELLQCNLVCKDWHLIIQSREFREALFVNPSQPVNYRTSNSTNSRFRIDRDPAPDGDATATPDSQTDVPPSAPQILRPRRPQSVSRAFLSIRRDGSPSSSSRQRSREAGRSASSTRASRSGQMYPSRPILNPLLQRYFRNAQFRFNPMHASDSASRYQAHLIIEREDFERWNGVGGASDGAGTEAEKVAVVGKEGQRGDELLVPSWCGMHLASPPITSVVAVVWERGAPWPSRRARLLQQQRYSSGETEDSEEQPIAAPFVSQDARDLPEVGGARAGDDAVQHTDSPDAVGAESSSTTGARSFQSGRRTFYRSNVAMSTLPSSAFYSTKQVHHDQGLTMGMLMVAMGQMFDADPELKAVKVCTQ